MREIKFTACTGIFSIDSTNNARNSMPISIHNFYVTEEGGIEDLKGTFNPGTTIPLKLTRRIIWPNGSTDVPGDTILDPECGFCLLYTSDAADE